MYGDTDVIRRRAAELREQGVDLRGLADRLVARTDARHQQRSCQSVSLGASKALGK